MKKGILITLITLIFSIGLVGSSFGETPEYGGVLRIIYGMGPRVLGYYPEMGPTDHAAAFPALETIMALDEDRVFRPYLAEDVIFDDDNLTMTIKLRKGIRFHDGSPLNAESCAWNYQLLKDTKKIQFSDLIKSIEIVDDYTVALHLTTMHNQLIFAYGWVPMLSKKSIEKKGKEWARMNIVGTGPFKQVEWKRDSYLIWVKNEDYWQKGKPYLDGIDVRYIPDSVTASSMMQAGEADLWNGGTPKFWHELEQKGFIRQAYWPGLPYVLYLNTKNPDGPMAKKKVREAVEYAIDKAAIAKALGFGYWKPLKMFHPPGEWAYDENWPGREYNPEKARKLLAEAGYPNGLKLELLAFAGMAGGAEHGEAIKAYLGDVGINVHLDMADPGRYWGSIFGSGWKDMALCFTGIDHNSLATIQAWFGHEPKTNLASFKRTPRLLALSELSITYPDEERQKEISRIIGLEIANEALLIPLIDVKAGVMIQPYVHTNYLETGLIRWKMADMWMEKH